MQRELTLAKQQSQDITRSQQCLESLLKGDGKKSDRESKVDKLLRPSPVKSKTDVKTHFSEPPAPPPQQPLPEKPDVAKALADPAIQPLLLRADTTRPLSHNASPTRADHSQALIILTQELKLAKDQIPSLEDRVRNLEDELKAERTARESAEERAHKLEEGPQSSSDSDPIPIPSLTQQSSPHKESEVELRARLDRIIAEMEDMKQRMDVYHRRAVSAESERDTARQSLVDMVEQKRAENAAAERRRSRSRTIKDIRAADVQKPEVLSNGHTLETLTEVPAGVSFTALLKKAGVSPDDLLTAERTATLCQLLAQQTSLPFRDGQAAVNDASAASHDLSAPPQGAVREYAWSYGPAATVLILGVFAMIGMNRIESVNR